jgi:hypothetical protein
LLSSSPFLARYVEQCMCIVFDRESILALHFALGAARRAPVTN